MRRLSLSSLTRRRRAALAIGASLVLLPSAGSLLGSLFVALVMMAFVAGFVGRQRRLTPFVAAALGGASFAYAPHVTFELTCFLSAWALASRAGATRRAALAQVGAFVLPPVLFSLAALTALGVSTALGEVERLAPVHGRAWLMLVPVKGMVVAALLRPQSAVRRGLEFVLAASAVALVVARASYLMALARSPLELFWSEAPFLANAVKLHLGLPLYGAPEDLASYSYSPLADLVHRALLHPLHAELSLGANRAVVVACQLAASATLMWALRPWLVALGASALLLASLALVTFFGLSNLLAVAIHPDHLLLLLVSLTMAVLLRGGGPGILVIPTSRSWGALVCLSALPVLAFATKLSGVGLAAAIVAIALTERDRRLFVAAAVGALLSLLTIPLFDASLGSFSFYAISLQSSHERSWARLLDASFAPFFEAMAAVLGVSIATFFLNGQTFVRDVAARRVALVASALLASSLPACVKVAGRENNLTVALFAWTGFAVIAAGSGEGRARRALAPLLTCLAVALSLRPPARLPHFEAIERELSAALERVAEARRSGKNVCSPATMLPDLTRGALIAPRNRLQSAVELDLGHRREADLLVTRLETCDYVLDLPDAIGQRGLPLADRWAARLASDFEPAVDAQAQASWYAWLRRKRHE